MSPGISQPDGMAPPVEVVAGVIRDARGRVLLARRTEGRDLAGLWEFPGGKREPGESAQAALARELHEELGIEAEIGQAVIRVPQAYPHKRLRLDVYAVDRWKGTLRGLEGQALAWVPQDKLVKYPMPPADRPVVAALEQPDQCVVTPAPKDEQRWLASLERALDEGASRVQLRAPGVDPGRWSTLVARAIRRCRKAGAEVLVNGDAGLALANNVGLHLRARQLFEHAHRPVPDTVAFSASCHTLEEVRRAEALGCDFALVGTVTATPSHPGAATLDWDGFAMLREQVSLPIYAIGGLGPGDLAEARRHGAQGIAGIRALWPDSRPMGAA
ncbi:Nudix family hydrolase [Lysobacter sp. A3-1-A15]|uniref:Nudix family hydrolase n=1 Tax=Novilysobacter viscosus TaxID=3098602 RepID=UPI0039838DEF